MFKSILLFFLLCLIFQQLSAQSYIFGIKSEPNFSLYYNKDFNTPGNVEFSKAPKLGIGFDIFAEKILKKNYSLGFGFGWFSFNDETKSFVVLDKINNAFHSNTTYNFYLSSLRLPIYFKFHSSYENRFVVSSSIGIQANYLINYSLDEFEEQKDSYSNPIIRERNYQYFKNGYIYKRNISYSELIPDMIESQLETSSSNNDYPLFNRLGLGATIQLKATTFITQNIMIDFGVSYACNLINPENKYGWLIRKPLVREYTTYNSDTNLNSYFFKPSQSIPMSFGLSVGCSIKLDRK